jgi:curved DNA-binding protein CbpA
MNKNAFRVLGIAPTEDGRAIRAAFLRLARIYHPDRFADMSDDVREEAERRMKEATLAYESLRSTKKSERGHNEHLDEAELGRRVAKYRETAARKREKEALDRERWRRWERVEEIARTRAKLEADIAARVTDEAGGDAPKDDTKPSADPIPVPAPKSHTRGTLGSRLDAARRGERAPLVRRS